MGEVKVSKERLEGVMLSQEVSKKELEDACCNGLSLDSCFRRDLLPGNVFGKICDYLNCNKEYLTMESDLLSLKPILPEQPVKKKVTGPRSIRNNHIENNIDMERLKYLIERENCNMSSLSRLIYGDSNPAAIANFVRLKSLDKDMVTRLCYFMNTDLAYLEGKSETISVEDIPKLRDCTAVKSHVYVKIQNIVKELPNSSIKSICKATGLPFKFVKSLNSSRGMFCPKTVAVRLKNVLAGYALELFIDDSNANTENFTSVKEAVVVEEESNSLVNLIKNSSIDKLIKIKELIDAEIDKRELLEKYDNLIKELDN